MKEKKKILVSLTTMYNWPDKVREIDALGIKEIALFPTPLKIKTRERLYDRLERTRLSNVPHVHLKDDCQAWELEYFIRKYKTKVFNLHPTPSAIEFIKKNKKYRNRIFLENLYSLPNNFPELLNICGGLCLDLAHWEDFGILQKKSNYKNFKNLVKKYKIGICHISSIRKKLHKQYDPVTHKTEICFNDHILESLSDLYYVKKYLPYLSDITSIELENSLSEQIIAKEYLDVLINSK